MHARLFHVSDVAGIEESAPRPAQGYQPPGARGDVVWAIEDSLLHKTICCHVTALALRSTLGPTVLPGTSIGSLVRLPPSM